MADKPINIDLRIPADLRFSAGVREFVEEFCVYCDFDRTVCNQVKLIIDELFMNAVRYGSGLNSEVILELSYYQNILKGMVEDAGEGKQKITKEELEKIILMQTENNVLTKTSGRGLAQIVKRWTNKAEVINTEKGGVRVSFEKNIEDAKEDVEKKEKARVELKKSSLKEYTFAFEGEIGEENLEENKKIVEDFLQENDEAYRLNLELSKLTYCNSTFIGQIAGWYNTMKKRGGEIVILNPNRDILDIIDLVGLTKVIPVQNVSN